MPSLQCRIPAWMHPSKAGFRAGQESCSASMGFGRAEGSICQFFSLKLQHGINGSVSYLQVFRYLFPSDQSKLELNGM